MSDNIIQILEQQITQDEKKLTITPSFLDLQNTVRLRECLAQIRARGGSEQ